MLKQSDKAPRPLRVPGAGRVVGLAVPALLLAGCAAAAPGAAPGGTEYVSRVFIDVRRSDSGAEFVASLRNALVAGFRRRGVGCMAGEDEGLKRRDAGKEIKAYYPDLVIAILQTDTNGVPSEAQFNLAVFRPQTQAPIWRADLSPESGGWHPASAGSIARELFMTLEEGGLINVPGDSR